MLFSPKFFGLENIPNDKPVLFVGNHALLVCYIVKIYETVIN